MTYTSRYRRVLGLMAASLMTMPEDALIDFSGDVLQSFRVPPEVERDKRDGWAMVGRGIGALAAGAEMPLNLRDEAGNVVGEVACLQDRDGDLWALLLWRRGESEAEWAARVRAAMITQGAGGAIVIGAEST